MLLRASLVLLAATVLLGCQPGQPAEPPSGWESDGEFRWWQPGVDTGLAFRDLADFEAMNLSEREDGLRPESPSVRNIQRRFLPLYRNHPELVDSVFAAVAVPMIEREATPGDDTEERAALVRQVTDRVRRQFQEPMARAGAYDPPSVPDSLQRAGISGTITLQVYLDEEGRPLAVKRVEGIHPAMDRIVMRNYAERSWRPAYLGTEPVRAWTRPSVTIQEQPQ